MIGLIGYGSFGKLMATHLSRHDKVLVYSKDVQKFSKNSKIKFSSLNEVAKLSVVIISVPMQSFEGVLHDIKNKLSPGALIIDVCSLKKFSCSAMDKILPKNVSIVGTHPLFGPQSCPKTIAGRKIAICNVRGNKLKSVQNFCEKKLKLKTIITTPDEHDKQMAYSQALTHYIGRVSVMMKVRDVQMSTKTYEDFLDIANLVKNDDMALFENIETMNPYAVKVREEFLENAENLHKSLLKKTKK